MRGRHLRALLALGTGVGLAGCGQILGVDGYSVAEPKDAGTRKPPNHDATTGAVPFGDAGTLFDPKPAYLTGAECEACMAKNCDGPLAECAVDSFCSDWLADTRQRPGPVATNERRIQRSDAFWVRDHGGVDAPMARTALTKCASEKCTGPCELGRDFSCTGRFDWPGTFPTETSVRVRFVDFVSLAGLPGWDVRACRPPACYSLGSAQTDLGGFAELTIVNKSDGLTPRFPEFDGFLLAEPAASDAGPTYYPLMLQQSKPLVPGYYNTWFVMPSAVITAVFQTGGRTFEQSGGLFVVQPWDCIEAAAKHVTVDVLTLDGDSFRECTECHTYYTDAQGIPSTTLTDLSVGPWVNVTDVPARATMVIVRDTSTRRAVGVLQFVTLPGRLHLLGINPPSTQQLADLPASYR